MWHVYVNVDNNDEMCDISMFTSIISGEICDISSVNVDNNDESCDISMLTSIISGEICDISSVNVDN